jgi:hypothetical protein
LAETTVELALQALALELGTATGAEFIKGRPTNFRPEARAPVGTVELFGWRPSAQNRIGQAVATDQVRWAVALYGKTEVELCRLVSKLRSWLKKQGSIEVSGTRVRLSTEGAERLLPEATAQVEQHALLLILNCDLVME